MFIFIDAIFLPSPARQASTAAAVRKNFSVLNMRELFCQKKHNRLFMFFIISTAPLFSKAPARKTHNKFTTAGSVMQGHLNLCIRSEHFTIFLAVCGANILTDAGILTCDRDGVKNKNNVFLGHPANLLS